MKIKEKKILITFDLTIHLVLLHLNQVYPNKENIPQNRLM